MNDALMTPRVRHLTVQTQETQHTKAQPRRFDPPAKSGGRQNFRIAWPLRGQL
jgi:hypothetical protein